MTGTSSRGGMLALVGLIIAVSMTTIDQTIVALSVPTIETDLGLTHDATQWSVNVYLVATAAFMLAGGRLSDVFGHKRVALIGVAGFGAASLLCGLAPEGDLAAVWLIGARAAQGIAGAAMFPAAIGLVVEGFPRERRGRAMALFFAITGAMTSLGPIAGGYLTLWTWRAIFWVNVPLALIALIIIAVAARPSVRQRERVDLLGAVVVAAGLGLTVFGLQQAGTWGWSSPAVIGCLVAGAALLVLFVVVERRALQPLVMLRLFRDRAFTLSVLAILCASFAFMPAFFFLSVYGQVSLQLSASATGLLFLKFFIGFVVASRLGSRRFDRLGSRSVLIIGGIVGALGFGWLSSVVTTIPSDPGAFFNIQTWPILIAGAGIGFMFSASSTDAVNRAIGSSYGAVTAISQTMRNLGGALGLAVLSTLVTGVLSNRLTASFTALGATAADAQDAVDRIGGAAAGDSGASTLPAAVQAQFASAVQTGYVEAVQWAFAGMAIAMGVIMILGLIYPRGSVSAALGASPAAATVPPSTSASD